MNGIVNRENWFDALPEPVRAAIGGRLQPIDLAAGTPLYAAGDPARGVFQVADGFLRLTGLQEDGRQVLITIYAAGACFAETAVIARRRLNHSVAALGPATVHLLPAAEFWQLYERFPAIADALCRKFAGTIGRQLAERESRAAQRLGQRIAAVFVDLAADAARATTSAAIVSLPITHTDLAEFFDVTRQSIQREMTLLNQATGLRKIGTVWHVDSLDALLRY